MAGLQVFRVRCPNCMDDQTFHQNKPFYISAKKKLARDIDDPRRDKSRSCVVALTELMASSRTYSCRSRRCRWPEKKIWGVTARKQWDWFNILLSKGLHHDARLEKVKRILKAADLDFPVRRPRHTSL